MKIVAGKKSNSLLSAGLL